MKKPWKEPPKGAFLAYFLRLFEEHPGAVIEIDHGQAGHRLEGLRAEALQLLSTS